MTQDSGRMRAEDRPSIHSVIRTRLERIVAASQVDGSGWVDVLGGVIAIVDRLKGLREEGTSLRPDVFVFGEDQKADIVNALGFHHRFQIGSRPRLDVQDAQAEVFETALKRCAPLAQNGWSVFIKWNDAEINFGVMRRVAGLAIRPPREVLRHAQILPAMLLYQASEDIVAIRGANDLGEDLVFSALSQKAQSAEDPRKGLVRAIAAQVEPHDIQRQTEVFVEAVLHETIVSGHGFLVGVKAHDDTAQNDRCEFHAPPVYDDAMKDGNFFRKWPIPLQSKLQLLENARKGAAGSADETAAKIRAAVEMSAQVQGWASLIPRMLSSDGMTLFDTKGQVLGFNIFVVDLKRAGVRAAKYAPPPARGGGARWRAFQNMCRLVDWGILVGAFYQSQDGAAAWYGPT